MNIISENSFVTGQANSNILVRKNFLNRAWDRLSYIKGRLGRNSRKPILEVAQNLFQTQLIQLKEDIDHFKDHLMRKNISKTNLQPAIKRLIAASELSFQEIYKQVPVFQEARNTREVIEIELITGRAWPLDLFLKLLSGEKFSAKENHQLSLWMEPLNRPVIGASPATLHLALLYLLKVGALGDRDIGCLGQLEYKLQQSGCRVLSKDTPEHRQLLKASQIYCNGKPYSIAGLDTPLSHLQVLRLKGEPNKRALVGVNPSSVHIFHYQNRDPWGVPTPHIFDVDERGETAIVEALDHPLSEHPWSTPLLEEDKNTIEPFVAMLKQCLKENRSPKKPFYHLLHLAKDGKLKTLEKLTFGPFSFNDCEEATRTICGGHHELYRHIMKTSGLKKHKVNLFFEEMVKKSLNQNRAIDFIDEAYIKGFKEKAISQRAEYLCQQASGLVKRCQNQTKLSKEEIQKRLLAKAGDAVGLIEQLSVSSIVQ